MNKKMSSVYAFRQDKKDKYGIIQILDNSSIYNDCFVRVFYEPIKELSSRKIEELIYSKNFYYMANFSDCKEGEYLGNFSVPDFIEIPKYLRSADRKLNHKLEWIVWKNVYSKQEDQYSQEYYKTYKQWDEKLCTLSPASHGFGTAITSVQSRWLDGFTLEKWDDEWENKLYLEKLQEHYPHEVQEFLNPNFRSAKKDRPTKHWKKRIKEGGGMPNMNAKAISAIDKALDNFTKSLGVENVDEAKAEAVAKRAILDLNAVSEKFECIETVEAEMLLEYLANVLKVSGFPEALDEAESLREW